MKTLRKWARPLAITTVLGIAALGTLAWAAAPPAIDSVLRFMKAGATIISPLQVGSTTTTATTANKVTKMLSVDAPYNFASADVVCDDSGGFPLVGAAIGDPCVVGVGRGATPIPSTEGTYSCYVSAADTVVVRHCAAGTADDPADAGYFIRVISSQ